MKIYLNALAYRTHWRYFQTRFSAEYDNAHDTNNSGIVGKVSFDIFGQAYRCVGSCRQALACRGNRVWRIILGQVGRWEGDASYNGKDK